MCKDGWLPLGPLRQHSDLQLSCVTRLCAIERELGGGDAAQHRQPKLFSIL